MRSELSRLRASLASAESRLAIAVGALEEISKQGRSEPDKMEDVLEGGYNQDDCYWQGMKHGSWSAGQIARAALDQIRSKP